MKSGYLSIILSAAVILGIACNSGPKVVEAETPSSTESGHSHSVTGSPGGAHVVTCIDFLHTDKYTYMDVSEGNERFWIAVPRQDVMKGATYRYTGGLLKRNFKSTEYDRVFETIFLVTEIAPVSGNGSAVDRALAQQQSQQTPAPAGDVSAASGDLVKISDLFANKTNYDGKVISVRGRCVKINKMIMGRNWVHIDDGSTSGTDLTVTTTADVPVGSTVTLTGTIALNKDFGAGYRYDVIMEGARVE